MEVEQVKQMRTKLERDIRNAAHALCDDFQTATGVQVAGVSISLLETASLDGNKKSYVTDCKIDLEF